MQTRRDHLQAYRFAMARLATALVRGDVGRGEGPTGRATLATVLGAGVVVLLCVGFAVYGLIAPVADTRWRNPGSIIVEQQTGNRYLLLDGQLRPVRNYASALLLGGRSNAVHTVSGAELGTTPHGAPVGIPGAPDSLPAPAGLLPGPWTWCLRPDLVNGQLLDLAPDGQTAAFPEDRQVLLAAPDGSHWLLWRGVRYPVPSDAALIALGLDGDRPVPAPQNWLGALPTGAPLAAAVPDAGKPAGRVAGHEVTVGQLFRTATGGVQHSYVMTDAGVAPASATAAALLAARPGAPAVLTVGATDIAAAPVSPDQSLLTALPDVLGAPGLDAGAQTACLRQRADGTRLTSQLVVESGQAATGTRTVLVPPTRGMLAVDLEQLARQNGNAQTFLVTDQGIAYPLGDSRAGTALGITGAPATALPEDLLKLLGHGPTLTARAAADTVQGG
ncbi:type VII secretion protein EccB [Kitasatospora sp. NPDC048722]|uniref:type VII secretion protein EccB n=1 Tax=Kitasatospora sp. NPDC048722 TaxID=3155639 RepID=UPI0033D1F303